MRRVVSSFITLLLAAALLGFVLGSSLMYSLTFALIMALAIIAWQVFQLHRFEYWVANQKGNNIPFASGEYFNLYRDQYRRTTKNRKRKRQLAGYLNQFRKAVAALPDAIVLINETGKIEWASPKANDVLGIRWPQDAGVRFTDLIRYPEVQPLLREAEPPATGVEVHSTLAQDQTINIKVVRYTNQLRMVIARDVSRLLKVNRIHTDFVANVSHELKTPLTVLHGYVEILQDSANLPAEFVKPLAQMGIQSVRMQLIVNDLLYLAKLEDNANEQIAEPVEVAQLINTIVETVQPLIVEKRHELELNIDPTIKVMGTASELHSAFSNLITNAIHYTPEAGKITVNWQDRGTGAVFSVRDNGIGIPARHIDRLTQRFYRVDNDRSRESGGTGLGLAIVKHVLQRHSADLEIDSTEGAGSEFRCIFRQSS